ncbi:hypothetical protein ABZ023_32565 [Streptomyces sp. NPDC006367]|uniref:hypothetical protein n=1 Tax=unclassified Streptomyces TaxID=2593676 RepID=UPI0033A028A3
MTAMLLDAEASRCPVSGPRLEPAIVMRSDQRVHVPRLRVSRNGLTYKGAGPTDRDPEGFLWPQVAGPETGRYLYTDVNPVKQRRAMQSAHRLLCQVGMGPATRTPAGVLWLVPKATGTPQDPVSPRWPEIRTAEPPVCAFHAPYAARGCKRMRRFGYGAFFAREAELVAVEGTVYRPSSAGGIEVFKGVVCELDQTDQKGRAENAIDPRFMLARHLVRHLRIMTPVDLADPELYRDAVPCNQEEG